MPKNKVFIISGSSGEGKTKLLKEIITSLEKQNIKVRGIYAEGQWKGNNRSGHTLVEIGGQQRMSLCSTDYNKGWIKEERFYFNPRAINTGITILENLLAEKPQLIVVDEIGPFELQGKIWANTFRNLLESATCPILITTKQKLINAVTKTFSINDFYEFPSSTNKDKALITIKNSL
jgi:nucleoside-triphosphatase THEP1